MWRVAAQSLVITPVMQTMISSPRKTVRRGAFVTTVLIAALIVGFELNEIGPSHYSKLGLNCDATSSEIHRAYRTLAKKLHPDRYEGDAQEGSMLFAEMASSYEELRNSAKKEAYDRYGGETFEQTYITAAIYYGIMGIVVFLATSNERLAGSRWWVMSLLAFMGYGEAMMIVNGEDMLPFIPFLTLFQKAAFLHSLFPPVMNAAFVMIGSRFKDKTAELAKTVTTLQATQIETLRCCFAVLLGVENILEREHVRDGSEEVSKAHSHVRSTKVYLENLYKDSGPKKQTTPTGSALQNPSKPGFVYPFLVSSVQRIAYLAFPMVIYKYVLAEFFF